MIPFSKFIIALQLFVATTAYADQLWTRSPSSVPQAGQECDGFEDKALRSAAKIDSLVASCLRSALSHAPANTFRKSDDGRYSVVAWKDMIFVEKQSITGASEFQVIRAKSPSLENIKAVATDSAKEELYVLDSDVSGNTQLLVYQLKSSGDQSPRRIVRGDFLKGADSLALDPVQARLYLGHSSQSKITVLRQMATLHHAGRAEFSPDPIKVYDLSASSVPAPTALAVDSQSSSLFVFDSNRRQAAKLVMSSDSEIKEVDLGSLNIKSLNVNAASQKLEMLTDSGLRSVALSQLD